MTTNAYVELTFSEVVRVVSSLADISASSIGSLSQQTLLTSSTGSVFFVNDGIDILSSLQFSHPVARVVVTSLRNMHNYCADGSKRFILYVTEILRSIQRHLEIQGHLSYGATEKTFLRELSFALKDFEKEYFPEKIFGKFLPLCHIESSDLDQTLSHLEQVVKTILISSHNDSDSSFLAMLIISFLQHNTSDTNSPLEVIESAIDHFDLFVAEGIGKHFSSSQTIPGILIPLQQQIPMVDFNPGKKPFVILWNFLEIDLKGNSQQTTIRITKDLDFPTLYSFKNSLCKRFLNDCNACGIQVILCCQEIPRFAETLFEQHQILAVPYVSEDTCEYFRCIFKKHPLNSINDQITDANICAASFCKKAFIEDSVYLQLGIGQAKRVCISSTLLLSAPTPALYHNLRRQIQKCLKSLRMCFWSIYGKKATSCDVSSYHWETTLGAERVGSSLCKYLPTLKDFHAQVDVQTSGQPQTSSERWSTNRHIPGEQVTSKGSDDCQEIPNTENLSNSSPRIVTIPVNVFQSRLCQFFEDVSFKEFCDSNSKTQLLGEILASAFRQVFLKCSSETKRNILECFQGKTFQKASGDSKEDPFPKKFWLPLQTEFHILQSALHLVQQLLRIEGIVQVKGNKNLNKI